MENVDVQIKFQPIYELICSMHVFCHSSQFKYSDLGPEWVKKVKKNISHHLKEQLTSSESQNKVHLLGLLAFLNDTGFKDTAGFLTWVRSLDESAIQQFLTSHGIEDEEVPNEFHSIVDALEKWDEQYFMNFDANIIQNLAEDASSKQLSLNQFGSDQMIEQVSNGFQLVDFDELKKVILIPQYHGRPINLYWLHPKVVIIRYASDTATEHPEEPTPKLLQSIKALSDKNRLKMLRYISDGERTFTELHKLSGLAKSTAHYHIVTLRASGLIRVCLSPTNERFAIRQEGFALLHQSLLDYVGIEQK